MKLPNIKIPRGVKHSFYIIGKHKTEIGTAVAVASSVAAFATAINSTFKAEDAVKEHKKKIKKVEEAKKLAEEGKIEYSEQTAKNDILLAHRDLTVDLIKVYAVPVALECLNIVATVATHRSLRKANLGLTSAYIGIDKAFKEYRHRVVDKYGEEVDKQLRYGYSKETVEFEEVDPETGKSKKVKEEVNMFETTPKPTDYSVVFDRSNANFENSYAYNMSWLHSMEQALNDNLKYSFEEFITLNDAYEALGFPKTKEGMVVGWRRNSETGDNYIKLTITPFNTRDEEQHKYSHGNPRLLIDFNVDGPIYDDVKKKDAINKEAKKFYLS